MSETDPLAQHLTTLRDRLRDWGSLLGPANAKGSYDGVALAYRFLYHDLWDAGVLLSLIQNLVRELQDLMGRIWNTPRHEGPRTIDPQSLEGQHHTRLLTLTSQLPVLIKALYLWLYHIHEDVEREPKLKAAVPLDLWRRLDAYCTIRNALLTHKDRLREPPGAAMRSSAGFQNTKLLLVSLSGLSPSAQADLRRLFSAVRSHLSPAEAAEQNEVEQMSILYSHLAQLPDDRGDLKADIRRFIAKHGAVSDSPEDLAHFLASLSTALTPPRASVRDTGA